MLASEKQIRTLGSWRWSGWDQLRSCPLERLLSLRTSLMMIRRHRSLYLPIGTCHRAVHRRHIGTCCWRCSAGPAYRSLQTSTNWCAAGDRHAHMRATGTQFRKGHCKTGGRADHKVVASLTHDYWKCRLATSGRHLRTERGITRPPARRLRAALLSQLGARSASTSPILIRWDICQQNGLPLKVPRREVLSDTGAWMSAKLRDSGSSQPGVIPIVGRTGATAGAALLKLAGAWQKFGVLWLGQNQPRIRLNQADIYAGSVQVRPAADGRAKQRTSGPLALSDDFRPASGWAYGAVIICGNRTKICQGCYTHSVVPRSSPRLPAVCP